MSQRSISDMLKPLQTTARRRQRVASISPDGDTNIVDSPSQDTPNTRKRDRIDYYNLNKYGLSGRTESSIRSSTLCYKGGDDEGINVAERLSKTQYRRVLELKNDYFVNFYVE